MMNSTWYCHPDGTNKKYVMITLVVVVFWCLSMTFVEKHRCGGIEERRSTRSSSFTDILTLWFTTTTIMDETFQNSTILVPPWSRYQLRGRMTVETTPRDEETIPLLTYNDIYDEELYSIYLDDALTVDRKFYHNDDDDDGISHLNLSVQNVYESALTEMK
jgi:hypothetical protein